MTTSLNATGTSLLQLHYTVFGSAPTLSQLNSYAGDYQALVDKGSSAAEARTAIADKILATSAAVDKLLPNLSSANYQATTILKNLGITNAGIISFVEKALDGTGGYGKYSLTTAVTFLSDYVLKYKTGDLSDTVWDAALVAGSNVIKGITPPSAPPAPVPTFTVNTDSLMGTAADETFVAAAGTWTAGDKVDGGTGNDTLNLTLTGTAAAGTISGIEVVNITATPNPATIDMSGVAGVTQINNANSANGASLTVNNVAAAVSTTITGGNSATTVNYGTAVTASTATTDAATVTLAGVSAGSSYVTAGIETLTLNSTTAANTLTTLTDTGITKLVIGGDKALTITNAVGGTTIGSVDASALKAALTMTAGAGAGGTAATGVTVTGPTDAAATLDLTTGANKDTIIIGAGKATVVAGAGNDTITVGGGDALITPGAGNDVLTLGAGAETIRFAEVGGTSADTLQNFGATDVIALNIGAAAVTGTNAAAASANAAFGVVPTGATSPVMQNVAGTATTNAVSFQAIAPNATATVGTVLGTSNVIALNGAYTDGTAAGVISALGTSADVGVTTTAAGRFLLVTYSVGNIAQVWSYGGDGSGASATVDTNINADELSLVATLNGVTLSSLSAANFASYLTPVAATTTVSSLGQTINLSGILNTVMSTPNASGQYLTAAADTINVGVGTLPVGAVSTTTGLTVIDPGVGDGDVLNATVLSTTWDDGSLISGIETLNLNMLVADTAFDASAKAPGTTTINATGTQGLAITNAVSGTAFGLGAGYTGTLSVTPVTNPVAAHTLNLNGTSGTSAATSPTFEVTGANVITALTINANASTTVNLNPNTSEYATATLRGTGNVTIFGTHANFGAANMVATEPAYTGVLTFRPTDTPASMDFSATGVVSGLDVLDFTDLAANAVTGTTITLPAAASGGNALSIVDSPTTARDTSIQDLIVVQSGSSLADSLTFTFGALTTPALTGAITAAATETVTINYTPTTAGTAFSVANITTAAALGTQTVNINGTGAFTLGTVTADNLNTTGVGSTGSVSATLANGTAGAVFTGGAGAATIIGSTSADRMTGGIGADTLTNASGGAATAADVMTGGAGSDTFVLRGDTAQAATAPATAYALASNVTDFSISGANGVDKIQLSATAAQYGGAATGLNATVAAAAAGSTVVMSIGSASAGTAITAGTDIIKLTAGVASAASLQTTFDAAIGTSTVTGIGNAGEEIFFTLYDTTNAKMVIGVVDAGAGNQVIASGDVVTLIGTVDMTAAQYAAFTSANFVIGA